jgi:hypothetical protein
MEELESRREQRSTTAGMEDDCREAGARATPGAVAEVDRVGNSDRRLQGWRS